jgi:RING-box protein 2
MADDSDAVDRGDAESQKSDKMFSLKKWNAVAMWSWDVECDTCAICRVQVMGECYIFMSCTWILRLWLLCSLLYQITFFTLYLRSNRY